MPFYDTDRVRSLICRNLNKSQTMLKSVLERLERIYSGAPMVEAWADVEEAAAYVKVAADLLRVRAENELQRPKGP